MKKTFTRWETIKIDLKEEYPGLLWDTVRVEKAVIKQNRYLEVDINFILEIKNDGSQRNRDKQD